jgi:hypothetical protein
MVLSDQRDMPEGCHKPIKLNTRSLNQRTTAQRFSSVPGMLNSSEVKVLYPT